MKVGLLLDDSLDSPDGVQQYILTLGEWLADTGHEVHYIVGKSRRKDIKNVHSLAHVIRIKFNGNRVGTPLLAPKGKIKALIRELKLDVVHVQMPYSPLFAGRFINELPANTKVIGSLHVLPSDSAANIGARALKLLLGGSLKRIDTILSNTSSTQNYFKQAWGVDSTIVPNPVDIAKFNTTDKFSWNERKVNVVFLGRMVERKGVLNLVDAISMLPASVKAKTTFHLGGKGPLHDKVKDKIRSHSIDYCVKTLGFISEDDKPAFLASADIAIFPSTGGESFGISLVEAMAAGSSVVLAGHNAGYDCVLGAKPNMMFDANNPAEIADCLRVWIEDAKSRVAASKWLARHVKQYDIKTVVGPTILKHYRSD